LSEIEKSFSLTFSDFSHEILFAGEDIHYKKTFWGKVGQILGVK
jgi:hypothetical protein